MQHGTARPHRAQELAPQQPRAGGSAGASFAAKGELKLGVTLPLSGGAAADGQPTLNGAQPAVDQINEKGGVNGYTIKLVPLDHAVTASTTTRSGAQDMQTSCLTRP